MECTGVPGALGVPANMAASRGGCNVVPEAAMVGVTGQVWLQVEKVGVVALRSMAGL